MQRYLNSLLYKNPQSHDMQNAISRLLQTWQKKLDASGYTVTVLMDLSKACDCLPHDSIIAKIEAHGFDNISLKLFHSYFSSRNQRVQIGSAISDWIDILTGIPQGILGHPMFNICINTLIVFIETTDICNSADGNTLYKSSLNISAVLNCLEDDISIVLNWFKVNSLKPNPSQFQFMVLGGKKTFQYKCKIEETFILSKDKVVLSGITINNNKH